MEYYLRNPIVRWGIGLVSGAIIAIIALTVFEGQTQQMLLLLALFDFLTTPFMLKHAVR